MKKIIVILATLVLVACPIGKVFADSFGTGSNYDYAQGGYTNRQHWTSYSIASSTIWVEAKIVIVGNSQNIQQGKGYAKAVSNQHLPVNINHQHSWKAFRN